MSPPGESEPAADAQSFTDVDLAEWQDESSGVLATVRTAPRVTALLAGLLAVCSLYLYDVYLVSGGATVAGWDLSRLDWLTLVASVGVVAFVIVPVALDPGVVRRFWVDYPKSPGALASLALTGVFVAVGVLGPVFVSIPEVSLQLSRQPPVYTSVGSNVVPTCNGPVNGGQCYGTWARPLGTTRGGESVLEWSIYGARTAVQFAVVTVAVMAPVAVTVGAVAGYYGGRIDNALMTYVDAQSAVPAVIIYLFVVYFLGPSLFALILVFGLLSWEEMARTVRASVLTERNERYVTAARSAGASHLTIIRRHVLPNVSSAVVTTVSSAVPKLILVEALFSFIGLSGDASYSWGQLMRRGVVFSAGSQGGGGPPPGAFDPLVFETVWWIAVVPALVLSIVVLGLTLVGDAVRETVDPR
jgi:peptide/nickel transport system permease protein